MSFFGKLYELMKVRCSSRHPAEVMAGLKLQRVDSSLVLELQSFENEFIILK
jgi:hypothetical protein